MKNKFHLGIYVSALAIGASLIPTDSPAGSYSAICQDGGGGGSCHYRSTSESRW